MKVYRTLEQLLADQPFFAGMAPEHTALLAGCGRIVRFRDGEYLFRQGTPANLFYLVREGRVALELSVPEKGPIVTETIEAGEVVGWSWLFPPYRWSSDARAIGSVRAVALDGSCLRGKCDEDPRLGYAIMQRFARIIIDRLKATRLQLLDLYGRDDHG